MGGVFPSIFLGPTKGVFSRLDAAGQAELTAPLEKLWKENGTAIDGTTDVVVEYLEVRAARV